MEVKKLSISWQFLIVLILILQILSALAFDPYQILGVTQKASQADIKKAYKKLVRKWHPDKNKHPQAEDRFIEISKAYEILSQESKRSEYDAFGPGGENTDFPRHHEHRFRQHAGNFYFEESFMHFPFGSSDHQEPIDEKHLLHFSHYVNKVVPDSFKKPYLIKVISDWCFTCAHIEPVWKEVVEELEVLGVGIGVVHAGYERRLARHLGAQSTPSIIGVISGKISFFHNAVVPENLRQFVENLLPGNLVEKVTNKNYVQFLSGWQQDNKPHVLLFDKIPDIPLPFKLTAFAHKDWFLFGYVHVGTRGAEEMTRQFNVNVHAPTILVFREYTDKPANAIQAPHMKKEAINNFFTQNKYLFATRLTNQKLFQELCPVKRSHRQRKYCVVLLTPEAAKSSQPFEAFLSFAKANSQDMLQFMHAYSDRQPEFANAFLPDSEAFRGKSVVSILERRNMGGRVLFKTLQDPWTGSESDKFVLLSYLEQLRKDSTLLSSEAVLPDLIDELAPMILVRWLFTAASCIADCLEDLYHNNWREMIPLLSLAFSTIFVLFGTFIIQAFCDSNYDRESKHPDKRKAQEKAEKTVSSLTKESTSKVPRKGFVEVTELTDVTYTSNLVRLRPGHMNVVLILSNSTKTSLLQKFALEVYTFTGSSCLHFSFLSLDKHREWLEYLLEFAQDAAPIPNQYDKHFLDRDYTGYVLALNGHKKYFCLFKPQKTVEEEEALGACDPDPSLPEGESRGKPGGLAPKPLKGKLSKLSLWMERLLEGSLQRFYIPSWPELD